MFIRLYYTLLYYFGTNLLTEGPAQIAIFFAYFSVSKEKDIKRSPNGMKPSETWFPQQTWSRRLGVDVKQQTRRPRGCPACPRGVGAPLTLVGPSWLNRPTSFAYIYSRTLKTSRSTTKNYFHCRNLLYPRDPILEPSPALRRRGSRPWRASTSSPRPLRRVVSSLPHTFGSIVIS